MMLDPYKRPYIEAMRDTALKQKMLVLATYRSPGVTTAVTLLIFGLYATGLVLLASPGVAGLVALLPLSVSMLLAWYLGHDCAHLAAFRSKQANYRLGEALGWVNGVAWFRFADYAHDHLRHHAEQVDLVGIELQRLTRRLSPPLRGVLFGLEACYLPVYNLLIKIASLLKALRESDDMAYRVRVLLLSVLTVAFWSALLWLGWLPVLIYGGACTIRIHVVRFVDAFQHSYEQVDSSQRSLGRGRAYEQLHTFSFPVARSLRPLNLLILNFGYHNAHHAMAGCPWFNLPRLDSLITKAVPLQPGADTTPFTATRFGALLQAYHRYRVGRILSGHEGVAYDTRGQFTLERFTGAFTDNLLG